MKTISYDITKASKPAIKELAHAIDTLAPLCVKRNGSRTGLGDRIHNNGGSKRLLDRHAGKIVDDDGKRKPVTVANANMWVRAVEECQRRELDVPVGKPLAALVTRLRKLRDAAKASK
tara:strand:- start:432 stop:785 length:354 start_codon:yes stop_codon:yes gene_type:complete